MKNMLPLESNRASSSACNAMIQFGQALHSQTAYKNKGLENEKVILWNKAICRSLKMTRPVRSKANL